MNQAERLASMGGQILCFFKTQPGDPAKAVADHLVKFWTPAMRDRLTVFIEQGGAAEPLLKEVVALLSART